MKPESNSNNIHVFRVSRAANKKDDSLNNPTSPPTVKSRTSISAETKRLICEDHIENPKFTQEAIAKKYGCKRTTIAKIIKSKDRWLSIESDTATSKRFRQRSSRYPGVENAVMLWLKDEHNSDISLVSDHMLRQQARKYAQEYNRDGADEFKASSSWLLNFKRRYINEMDGSLDHRSTPSSSPVTTTFTDAPMQDVEPLTIQFDTPITPTTSPATSNNNSHNHLRTKNQVPKIHSLIENSARLVTASSSSFIPPQTTIDEERASSTTTEDEDVSMEDDMRSDEGGGEVDYCDDMESPNFDNIDDMALSPENTTRSTKEATTTTTIAAAAVPVTEESSESSINPKQQPPARKITKSQAKKHLEAALEFFTSQRSSKPMSADMIKLILQNDF